MSVIFLSRISFLMAVFLLSGCAALPAGSLERPDPSLDYIGSGESSTLDKSPEKAKKIAKQEAVESLVAVVSSDVIDLHSRFLGGKQGARSASSSVITSRLNLAGKVRFYEIKSAGRIRVLAYLRKSEIHDGFLTPNAIGRSRTGNIRSGEVLNVTGKGFASLSEYGVLDAREIAMRRAMKDALMKGRMLYQGSVFSQNVQMGSIHERSLFIRNAFDILGMQASVLPEIDRTIEGVHVRLLAVQVRLRLRRKPLDGPLFHVRLDRQFYESGQSAHLFFSVGEPLYVAVFDRYGFSGSAVGILPTAEKLPESAHYRSSAEEFFVTSPGEFRYPPDDPRVSLVASLPSGVTKESEEYLVILVSKKPFPIHPFYRDGSPYFELNRDGFEKFLGKMLKRPLSDWSMKTVPFIVYGNPGSKQDSGRE
ncbi:MAG: hypothetical protein ACYCXP_01985 [Leptospirillum sp.]